MGKAGGGMSGSGSSTSVTVKSTTTRTVKSSNFERPVASGSASRKDFSSAASNA
jgi:hypothetical protein